MREASSTLRRNAILCEIDLFIKNCNSQGIEISCEEIAAEFGISNSESREAISRYKKGSIKHPQHPNAEMKKLNLRMAEWDAQWALLYPDEP